MAWCSVTGATLPRYFYVFIKKSPCLHKLGKLLLVSASKFSLSSVCFCSSSALLVSLKYNHTLVHLSSPILSMWVFGLFKYIIDLKVLSVYVLPNRCIFSYRSLKFSFLLLLFFFRLCHPMSLSHPYFTISITNILYNFKYVGLSLNIILSKYL
jgi:hypothetical protein